MGIITKEVITKWNNMNKEVFVSKGYEYTGYRNEVIVKVEDLPKGSSAKIETECDWCKKMNTTTYGAYNKIIDNFGNYLCISCRAKEYEIASKNVLYYTHPHLAKLLKHKDDAFMSSYGSNGKLCFICEFCKKEYLANAHELENSKTNLCPFCSDGFSYNNKFMGNVLESLGIKYESEYYNKDWCSIIYKGEKKRVLYDFLIDHLKLIIEMDGAWHKHDNTLANVSKEDTMMIDKLKENLARDNGYTVIRIDCDSHEHQYINMNETIKVQLIEKLSSYFDFSNIDWEDIDKRSQHSEYKKVWDLINNGITSPSEIKKEIGKSISFVRSAITKGRDLGTISYKTQHEDVVEKTKKLKEYWDMGIFDLEKLQVLVGTNETVSLRKYLNKIYEDTNDVFYLITEDKYCYCVEEDVYYSIYYLAEKRKDKFPNKTLKDIYTCTYRSMWRSIDRKGRFLNKHWAILSRQQAYFEANKNNKKIFER